MRFIWADSYSIGTQGFVEMLDAETGRREHIRWDVTGSIADPLQAADEALRRLVRRATPREVPTISLVE